MGSLTYVNAEYWEIRGGRGLQHLDVEKRWQAARILPDRSGAGPEGFSVPDCPLARMKLGPARQDEDASAQDLPPGSPRDIARYRQEFDRHDYLNSGFVATKELREILKALGRNLSDAAASILLKQIDSDGSGTVDFEEFLGGCFGIREPRPEDKPPSPHEVVYRQMLDCIYRDDLSKMRKLAVEHGIRDFVDPVTAVGLIHVAARSGGERMVLLLLELSADPNEVTDSGETPLHFAAESSHRERGRVITALLAAGADTRTRDTDSSNACLEYMYKESKASGFAWEDDREMLERLKNHRRKNFAAHGYHLMKNKNKVRRGWMISCVLTKLLRPKNKRRLTASITNIVDIITITITITTNNQKNNRRKRKKGIRLLQLQQRSKGEGDYPGLAHMVETRAQKVLKHVVLQTDNLQMQDTSSQG
ncbi:hypothetical protein GUITHDRAFT_140889 [Guillardia theta CCMP2712]|uniref:EF-hand domain-containing protein n=2 Tax=Guillardia theta TaxID=55529 RepID=L1J3Y4_GUITC|nr:hypothetical protein GUITHDRAFT_140889 [Guillardia theta CCMP2712]EKX43042.1 hypothetical protein GUITHDRAFT_140889 [Guillardia theta CCMP2712]|eukprot:XP_005830022.1 hypothetical protein GUITHDRAFT_140889 [Guillardia theta CCMP2712]